MNSKMRVESVEGGCVRSATLRKNHNAARNVRKPILALTWGWGRTMNRFLRASIVVLAVAVAAAAATIAESQGASPSDETFQVASFDNWELQPGRVSNSYLLVGRSREQNGQFWLNCDPNGLVNVAVPLNEINGRDRLRSFPVTIWSDGRNRHELRLLVFQNFVAVAIDYQGGRNDKLATFLDVLRTAKQTFAISYGDRVFEFDVAKLPLAQARFMQLCGRQTARASIEATQ